MVAALCQQFDDGQCFTTAAGGCRKSEVSHTDALMFGRRARLMLRVRNASDGGATDTEGSGLDAGINPSGSCCFLKLVCSSATQEVAISMSKWATGACDPTQIRHVGRSRNLSTIQVTLDQLVRTPSRCLKARRDWPAQIVSRNSRVYERPLDCKYPDSFVEKRQYANLLGLQNGQLLQFTSRAT